MSNQGCGFTALKVNLINQIRIKAEDGGKRYSTLACEHRSMTSSTTELLDFIHTRPGEPEGKAVRVTIVCLIKLNYYTLFYLVTL